MSAYKTMLEAVSYRFNDKVLKECAPLFHYLNLNEFWHYKITNSGAFYYLCSHVGFDEYFVGEKLYFSHPYFRHPKFYRDGISFEAAVSDQSLLELVEVAGEKFNFHHSLILIHKTSNGVEFSGFSSSCSDQMQKMLMLNELPLLRLFVKNFREKNQKIFLCLEDNKINLIQLMGSVFYEEKAPVMPQVVAREALFRELGVMRCVTSEEAKVAKLLIRGFSAREMGERLFLSKRTVEHRLERMKEKLGCESKAELVQKARELEKLGLLE